MVFFTAFKSFSCFFFFLFTTIHNHLSFFVLRSDPFCKTTSCLFRNWHQCTGYIAFVILFFARSRISCRSPLGCFFVSLRILYPVSEEDLLFSLFYFRRNFFFRWFTTQPPLPHMIYRTAWEVRISTRFRSRSCRSHARQHTYETCTGNGCGVRMYVYNTELFLPTYINVVFVGLFGHWMVVKPTQSLFPPFSAILTMNIL